MITVIYKKPEAVKGHKDVWLIGYTHTQFEKCKCNTFHFGTYAEAQAKIDSYPSILRRYTYRK